MLRRFFMCVFCVITLPLSASSPIEIRGFDFIEFYVGSAKAVAYWHAKAFGFDITGYAGPETGAKDRTSYFLTRGDLKFVITSATTPCNFDVTNFVLSHGDGVKRIGYHVKDVNGVYDYVYRHGGIPVEKPHKIHSDDGFVERAAIKLYDDTEIVLINYDQYQGIFQPGFAKFFEEFQITREDTGIHTVDHIVGNVRENEMAKWAEYFNNSFNFSTYVDFGPGDIQTQYSALLSKVVKSDDNKIRHPINEPYFGLRKSQIEEFIEEYHGTGVQHIALVTDDIVKTITAMRKNGVEFLNIPDNYYDTLRQKHHGRITENIDDLQKLGILCDLEGEGYLLQIFTKPTGDRPTFFYEIIQRRDGATGFGKGNFQALFESIEREQERRNHLTVNE